MFCFAFRSMTHFKLNFVRGVMSVSKFIFLHVESKPADSTHFLHLHLHFSLTSTLYPELVIFSYWVSQALK